MEKSNEKCVVQLEKIHLGEVHLTETRPGAAAGNQSVYRRLGEELARLRQALSGTHQFSRVILDADPEVPYEHIIGILNGCKEHGINDIEFVADWAFEALYR